MLKLYDNLYLDADSKCFMLVEDEGKFDKKNRPIRKVIGYYTTIGSALKGAFEKGTRSAVRKAKDFRQLKESIEELSKKIESVGKQVDESISLGG